MFEMSTLKCLISQFFNQTMFFFQHHEIMYQISDLFLKFRCFFLQTPEFQSRIRNVIHKYIIIRKSFLFVNKKWSCWLF